MLNLREVTTATTTNVDSDPLEPFYLQHVLPALVVEFFMDSNISFNEEFLSVLSEESGLSGKMVWSIANNIRIPEYSESLMALTEMIIERVGITGRSAILDESFTGRVERLVINSKHNEQVRMIADAAWTLVERIFTDNGSDLTSQRSVKKCQIKKVIVYILLVLMRVYLKHHQKQTFAA